MSPETDVTLIGAARDRQVDVAGGGLDVHAAPDLAGTEVGARALDVDAAGDTVDVEVTRRRLDVQSADRASGGDVRRLRADRQPGVVRAADPALDAAAAEDRDRESFLLRDVDEDGRPMTVRAQLDACVVDEPLRLFVVGDELDLDAAFGARVDLDVAARQAHIELHGALDVE